MAVPRAPRLASDHGTSAKGRFGSRVSSDSVYRNFLRKEFRRRMQAHKRAEAEAPKSRLSQFILERKSVLLVSAAALAVVALLFFTRQVINVVGFSVLLLLASFSTVYKRKLGMPLGGIELVTFGTVLVAVAFGPVPGLLFGLISSLASEVLSQNIGPFTWIYVITMGFAGFLAAQFPGSGILLLGMLAALANILVNQVAYIFIGDEEVRGMTVFYIFANIVFNFLVFSTIAGFVLGILA